LNVDVILAAIKDVVPTPAALHEPLIDGNAWAYVKDCLDSGWVSSVGSYVDRLEQDLAVLTGAKFAVATVNGTAALHCCLLLAGVESGDEVLMPSLTFIATANAASYCGAIPHFVECEELTLGVDPIKLAEYLNDIVDIRGGKAVNRQSGRTVRALVCMHTFGHPADLDPLIKICGELGIVLVEDAAESLGSMYKGHHCGTQTSLAALSFNGNKIVTSGGGGAILTNDEALAKKAKHITTTAKVSHKWNFNHDQIGFNYRLPNVNAAIGCAQLESLPKFLASKRHLAEQYITAFENVPDVKVFKEPKHATSNYWLNTILLDKASTSNLETLLEATNSTGTMTRPAWNLMHRLPMYDSCPCMNLEVSENLSARILNVPSSARLGDL